LLERHRHFSAQNGRLALLELFVSAASLLPALLQAIHAGLLTKFFQYPPMRSLHPLQRLADRMPVAGIARFVGRAYPHVLFRLLLLAVSHAIHCTIVVGAWIG
jgi:hypothetical protein